MQSQIRKRAPAWTEREVRDLIAVWGNESVLSELCSKRRNANIFEKISKGVMDRGYNRDPQQCRVKIKELRQAYQKTKEANGHSGSEPQTDCFYDELHAILGGAPTTTPPSVDTCKVSHKGMRTLGTRKMRRRRIAHNRQVEKPFSLTARNFLSPWSQYPSKAASQTMKPDKAPLKPVQIRRQKNCTRDETFSELMQSSRTERAQQNVWRQTMAESRKTENEREDRRDEQEERLQEQEERWRQRDERR
ncbi:uncharacterized protein LOC141995763 [Natator depressus]|uniref:uncharacterized protein LOC141995763 n=1 Tax=Natator depressus TaxID=27790 RepID=UPI003EB77290